MQKTKVMHLLKSGIYSGAENVVFDIIRELSDHYDFLYVTSDGEIRNRLKKEHIPSILLKHYNLQTICMVIDRFQPDIIHAHDFTASVYAAFAAGRKVPVISQIHYDPPWAYHVNAKTILYQSLAGRIQKLYLVTPVHVKKLAFYSSYKDKIRIVGNPVNIDNIRKTAAEQGEEEKSDILFIGRLEEQKDPFRFIEIIDQLKKQGMTHIHAIMLGDGELQTECALAIRARGLLPNIEMKGFVDTPLAYLKNTRVLCMTSKYEGFGLVCVEAGALGIPVVTTKTSGTMSIYRGTDHILMDNNIEMEHRIMELLKNPNLWKAASHESFKIADKMDNYQSYFRKIDRGYQGLMKK